MLFLRVNKLAIICSFKNDISILQLKQSSYLGHNVLTKMSTLFVLTSTQKKNVKNKYGKLYIFLEVEIKEVCLLRLEKESKKPSLYGTMLSKMYPGMW